MRDVMRILPALLLAPVATLALAQTPDAGAQRPQLHGAAAQTTGGYDGGQRVVVNTLFFGGGAAPFERVCPDPTPDEQAEDACDLKTAVSGGDRLVTFAVSGLIDLAGGSIDVEHDNVTIDGESAPNQGVGWKGGGMAISGSNVVVRHVGCYKSADYSSAQCFTISATKQDLDRVVLDHVLAVWSADDPISTYNRNGHGVRRLTVQNSLIAEGTDSSNMRGQGSGSKSFFNDGSPAEGTIRLSFYRNLMMSNGDRNPDISVGYDQREGDGARHADRPTTGRAQVSLVENVIYNTAYGLRVSNYGKGGSYTLDVDAVRNLFKSGPWSNNKLFAERHPKEGTTGVIKVYLHGNRSRWRKNESRPQCVGIWRDPNQAANDTGSCPGPENAEGETLRGTMEPGGRVGSPLVGDSFPAAADAVDAYEKVLASAGPKPQCRNSVIRRLVKEAASGTTWIGTEGLAKFRSYEGPFEYPDLSQPCP
jgi:hypothetical protein